MTNWSNFGSSTGARVTTWDYDNYRGLLSGKRDDAALGAEYARTDAGRLATITWARTNSANSERLTRTNSYQNGDSGLVSYNDESTPWVTNHFNRLGQLTGAERNGVTETNYFNELGILLSEGYSGGGMPSVSVTNLFNANLRRSRDGHSGLPLAPVSGGRKNGKSKTI
jgi:hypothetical protein